MGFSAVLASCCLVLSFCSLFIAAQASEIDSFSRRGLVLGSVIPPAVPVIDAATNERLLNILNGLNARDNDCNPKDLEDAVVLGLSGHKIPNVLQGRPTFLYGYFGFMEPFVDRGHDDEHRFLFSVDHTQRQESIYRYLTPRQSIPIRATLGGAIRVGKLLIGSDKFGHFLGQGYEYYRTGSLKKAIARGDALEDEVLGYSSSGVYSYADLSANFAGYQFYKQLYKGDNPYIICQEGAWKLNERHPFTWADYITPAWDEAINCSGYRSANFANRVKRRIVELQEEQRKDLTCPVALTTCVDVLADYRARYGKEVASHLISPQCSTMADLGVKTRWSRQNLQVPGESPRHFPARWID